MPGYEDEEFEIRLKLMKDEMMDEVKTYIAKECDEKGNIKKTNLSKQEHEGLKECNKLNKDGKQVYYTTDKSRKMAVDTPENYIEAMKKHTDGDKKVTQEEVRDIEKKLNGHSVMIARILKMGENWKHEDRVKRHYINKWTNPGFIWATERP